MLGLERRFHRTAVGGAIMLEVIAELAGRAKRVGISYVELGWILEENAAMRRIVEWSGAVPDNYRIYEKRLRE